MLAGLGLKTRRLWADLTFGYKYFFVTSFLLMILTLLKIYVLFDNPEWTIYNKELWRPFFSFYAHIDPLLGSISILFAFFWFIRLFPFIVTFCFYLGKNIFNNFSLYRHFYPKPLGPHSS